MLFGTLYRCGDMPLGHLNRRCHSHVVGIIPGPKEPDKLDPYLEPLLDEFKAYGPKGRQCLCRTRLASQAIGLVCFCGLVPILMQMP